MKHVMRFLWQIYARWSNFYSWVESKIYLENDGLLRTFTDTEYRLSAPIDAWKFYTNEFLDIKHYGRDKWYMGFDVVSSPIRFVNRGEGDCDDFASLGVYFFGKKFAADNKKKSSCEYALDGLYCMKFSSTGHCCAVWRTSSSVFPKLFVVNNNAAFFCSDEEDFVKRFSSIGQLDMIGVLNVEKGKLSFDRMYVVENDKMRRV